MKQGRPSLLSSKRKPEATEVSPQASHHSPSFGISAVHNLGTQSSQQHLCGAVLVINSGGRGRVSKRGRGNGPPVLSPGHRPLSGAAVQEGTYTAQCKGVKGFPSRYENGLCSSNNSRQSSCPGYEEGRVVMERNDNEVPSICPVPSLNTPFYFQIQSNPGPSLNPLVPVCPPLHPTHTAVPTKAPEPHQCRRPSAWASIRCNPPRYPGGLWKGQPAAGSAVLQCGHRLRPDEWACGP